MLSKLIDKFGRITMLGSILTFMSPDSCVKAGGAAPPPPPPSLNLIKANIDSGNSAASPSSNGDFNECDPGWKKND